MQLFFFQSNLSIHKIFGNVYLKKKEEILFEIKKYWQIKGIITLFIVKTPEYPFEKKAILFGSYPLIDKFLQTQD